MPSKKLWAYIAKLEKVIKSTMESSPEISELVEKIQQEGVEVSLNCIALFSDPSGKSFTGPGGAAAAAAAAAGKGALPGKRKPVPRRKARGSKKKPAEAKAKEPRPPEFKVTDDDRKFLRDIGIRFD